MKRGWLNWQHEPSQAVGSCFSQPKAGRVLLATRTILNHDYDRIPWSLSLVSCDSAVHHSSSSSCSAVGRAAGSSTMILRRNSLSARGTALSDTRWKGVLGGP